MVLPLLLLSCIVNSQVKYSNPILAGFYPDPSICRVGDDYYLVNSTFAFFPGLPVFHSTDLVNWQQIGNAIDRNEQLDLSNANVSGGLFAPAIRFNNGLFFITCTCVSKGGNFIITAKDPKGPWSNPIWTPAINGIDPSLFFDDDGKAYITYNSIPPDNKALYDGHRTIRIIEYDVNKKITVGDNKIIVNGGTDISQKPVWIEGPHMYKINGWYFLMCAEGGTGSNHSEVIFRSKNVAGPFVPYGHNPILTQRNLNKDRQNPVTSTGHADLVETQDGKWYAVFLGCRPYQDDYYNTGRETFMAPVTWNDGWPIINPGFEELQYEYPVPFIKTKNAVSRFSGNYTFKEDFNSSTLNNRFVFLRNPEEGLYKIQNGFLELPLKEATAGEKKNPAFIGFRQAHLKNYASLNIKFNAASENEKAGLMIFQNENYYYLLCKSVKDNKPVVELYKSAMKGDEKIVLLASAILTNDQSLLLKIRADKDTYSFYYSEKKGKWTLLKDKLDGKFLSTHTAGGFVGCMYAMYATSGGVPSVNKALFDWFEYKGDDDIYKKPH
ncbi:MAG: glycoside hydrolase family 43 protein [Bacteroidetes bacterium]|nr:glycoside hydrolase family 43 protein [Bacteroidota bacterium]